MKALNAISKVRVVPSLLAAVLLAAGGAALSASPADAATAYVTLVFPDGSSHAYACAEGHTYHTSLPSKVARVESDCGVRVWLHQNRIITIPVPVNATSRTTREMTRRAKP
jgi:hypothetical protein